MFGVLFGIFAIQYAVLELGALTSSFFGENSMLGQIGNGVGAIAFMTIGAIPFVALPVALCIAIVILGWRWMQERMT